MDDISPEQGRNNPACEEELKMRAWETLPRVHKLTLFIHERFRDAPFEGSQLYNEFLNSCSARRDVLRQSMEELKKKGFVVTIQKISHRRRFYKTTPKLIERAISIKEELDGAHVATIPKKTLQLRGYLRSLKGGGAHLNIFSKALSDVAKEREIRCQIFRHENSFIVRGSQVGPRRAYAGECDIDLSLPMRLLYSWEAAALMGGKLLPVKVYIIPEDWGLEKWELFTESKEAQTLVKELSEYLEINVLPSHNYNVNKWRFDIETDDFVVEVTAYKPRRQGGPHSSQASVVRSKVLDALLYSLETNKNSIVILSSAWAEKGYMHDLKLMTEKHGCHIIFVDFDDVGWPRKVVDQILKITKCPGSAVSPLL